MMKAAPASPFVVAEPEFLFEFLIIPLDDPALFGERDQILQMGGRGQSRQPVLTRLGFSFGPFDQQPFFRVRFGLPVIAVRRPHAHSDEAGAEFLTRTLAPRYGLPRFGRECQCQFFRRDWLVCWSPTQQSGRPAHPFARKWWKRLRTRFPY